MESIGQIVNNIITATQSNLWLTFRVIIALYFIKGFIMIIPIQALYLAAGAVFGFFSSVTVNIMGIAICLTVSYIIGRCFDKDRTDEFIRRYPRLQKLSDFERSKSFFFSYIIRIVGFIPCDVVSVYCGIKRIPFCGYLTGSVLGMLPALLLTSIMGANIRNPASPRFLAALIFQFFTFILSLLIYNKYKRKTGEEI